MKRARTFSAMLVVTLFLVVFYMTVHLETTLTVRALKNVSKSKDFTTLSAVVHIVTVSNDLRQMIPKNGAYWNRLLYSAMQSLENGENPRRKEPHWSVCREENRELLKLNVHDFDSYPALIQEFLRGLNCKSPPLLIDQPYKCVGAVRENKTLLFAIKSSPRNFERRQAVRETWGREGVYQGGMRVRLVFVMGNTAPDDPDLSVLLSFEAKHYEDILQWDFNESLLNLTLKMNLFLQWTVKNCPSLSFVFSGDDDVFINTPDLIKYTESLDASKASQLYAGQIISTASPLRNPRSKYFIPHSFYNGPYAPYAGGGGFLFSGALLKPLFSVSQILPLFPIDDVYIGMLMKALGIPPESHGGFRTFDVRQQDRENICVHKNNLLIHQRLPHEIEKMWKGINSPLLTC
ncbi:N-acetyllactosaminide beta-1,3-N-acetylglucosaminyltransferase 2 [Nematolebias whitei]|uniref:N-acetyllactosaminide beta-1,3-N-acetylglucosaminyltransferase 2 n=1 Tax=Nematolebias whitei TaxID=451745 RepID=UPI001899170F|nr:N-acetyllactosaminide beta-1,3-N-acetylglucosaminyltransferase 2 [Nematolebias whitei]